MNTILFGATGMIGSGALIECLRDARIGRVLVIGRRSCGVEHEKLEKIIISDFYDYSGIEDRLSGYDACLFCLGTTAVGKSEEEYRRMTYDLTLAAARTLLRLNPGMTFCYVSGEGADDDGTSRQMWARVRGETERALQALPFGHVRIFRPFYIHPVSGVRSSTGVYRIFYKILSPFYPLLKRIFPGYVTTTATLGRALIEAGLDNGSMPVLRSRDINRLGEGDG